MKQAFVFFAIFFQISIAYTQEQTLFRKGDADYACFRIPAMVLTQQESVLVFAEARKNGCSDTGDIDLVMRRSVDGGKSWSPIMLVRDNGRNVSGNPVPILDKTNGRIILVYCENRGEDTEAEIIAGTGSDGRRVFVIYSDTDGLSWSAPVEITKDVKKDDWTWYATGPCHGIQLQSDQYRNRLIVPSNHVKSGTHNHFSQMLYSDDGGKSWNLGESTTIPNANESTATELPNGTVLLNMRNMNRQENHRLQAQSADGGETLTPLQHAEQLIEPVCQGSIVNYTRNGKITDTLLFSNPHSTVRKNMTIQISRDGGESWQPKVSVYEGHSAYSDMAIFNNGDVGIVFENGLENAYEKITFLRINSKRFK
ncbi:MAG: sialidase family protein [Bacteroidia bacterium]|nr:sialidase family protein [Bacteroidia bacterium]